MVLQHGHRRSRCRGRGHSRDSANGSTMLDVILLMLEKGKGLVLGKLRTIQLVLADFQLLIRILVNERMVGVIETDERIYAANCG